MKSFKQRLEGKLRVIKTGNNVGVFGYSQEDVLKAHEDYKKDLIKELDKYIKEPNLVEKFGLRMAKKIIEKT